MSPALMRQQKSEDFVKGKVSGDCDDFGKEDKGTERDWFGQSKSWWSEGNLEESLD